MPMRMSNLFLRNFDESYLRTLGPERWGANFRLLSLFMVVLSLVFSCLHILPGRHMETLLWLSFGALFTLLFFVSRRPRWEKTAFYLGLIALEFYAMVALLLASPTESSALWLLTIPFLVPFLFGRVFARAYLALMAGSLLFVLSPVLDVWRAPGLGASFLNGFPLIFTLFCIFGLLLEVVHENIHERVSALLRRAESTSFYDVLTGLYHRRLFPEAYRREVSRNRRHQGGLQLLCLDINEFSKVNARYGTAVGDELLSYLAQLINKQLREEDYIFRWDGDAFMLLLPHTSRNGGINVRERLEKALEKPFVSTGGITVPLDLRIGLHDLQDEKNMDQNLELLKADMDEARRATRRKL